MHTVASPTTELSEAEAKPEMAFTIDRSSLLARLSADEEFASLAIGADIVFALATPTTTLVQIRVHDGRPRGGSGADFTVVLEDDSWASLLADQPAAGAQHLLAHLAPRGAGEVLGDHLAFAQHLHLVRRAIEVLADRPHVAQAPFDLSRIEGKYVRVDVESWGECDVYVESVGSGRPVVFLHTAGADSSQFHGLFSLAERFPGRRLISFDLPWHGRSSPARGRRALDYELTSQTYAGCIAAVIAALNLDEPPVLVGASMAGAAVVEVAARYPASIAAAIGCQVGPRVANRHNAWLRNPKVNQALFVPEWTFGLMSPHSPKLDRDRVWWGYSQGGYAVYERDIVYYTTCWDIDNVASMFDSDTPPVVLMSGAYDYSVPSAATRELSDRIPGSVYHAMPDLGHFPHAENPVAFAEHLAWALTVLD